jgi:hypothetical protein
MAELFWAKTCRKSLSLLGTPHSVGLGLGLGLCCVSPWWELRRAAGVSHFLPLCSMRLPHAKWGGLDVCFGCEVLNLRCSCVVGILSGDASSPFCSLLWAAAVAWCELGWAGCMLGVHRSWGVSLQLSSSAAPVQYRRLGAALASFSLMPAALPPFG